MGSNIVPTDSLSFFTSLQRLSTSQQQLAIIRPTNPPPGIAGFLFNIVGDESVDLTSDITDHYIEDNTAVQDNIALRPEVITVRGIVAELAQAAPAEKKLTPASDPLTPNPEMVPELTPGAVQTQAIKVRTSRDQAAAVADGQSLFGVFDRTFGRNSNQTKQTEAFLYFYALWQARELFSVETPWGFFNTMAILSLRSEQPEDTKSKSDFTVTFKKIRIAQNVSVNLGQLAGRLQAQQAPVSQNGNAGLAPATTAQSSSILFQMTHPNG